MKYCKACVQPDTRPGIRLNEEGVCNACVHHASRPEIDWEARKIEFERLLDRFRGKGSDGFDCVIPVSGGKDSIYQVLKLKHEYGMNPLCVTYRTPLRTPLGQKNLDSLIRLNVMHQDISFPLDVERKLLEKTLVEEGSSGIPCHMGLLSVALKAAIRHNIHLVVWGENAAQEYGGTAGDEENPFMDRNWCLRYGCLQNREPLSYVCDTISARELAPYDLPADDELRKAQVAAVFLGYYFPWDPVANFRAAKSVGFCNREEGPVLGLYDFADLDCHLIPLHHFTKWYKFGMGRTFDNASVEIRNGRMTREQAVEKIRTHRDIAWTDDVRALCEFIGWSRQKFVQCMRSFANPAIWIQKTDGYVLPDFITGEAIEDWQLYEGGV